MTGIFGFILAAAIGIPGSAFEMQTSALWAAWVQAIGSIGAILIAAAVPTALYLQQRRADRIKQLAKAKIAIAFALDGIVESLWELEFVTLPQDEPQEFLLGLKEIIEATEVSVEFKDALKNADAYPSLLDDMAAYMVRSRGLNIRAQTAVHQIGTKHLSKNAGSAMLHEVGQLVEAGTRLRVKMQAMAREGIH